MTRPACQCAEFQVEPGYTLCRFCSMARELVKKYAPSPEKQQLLDDLEEVQKAMDYAPTETPTHVATEEGLYTPDGFKTWGEVNGDA